MLCYTLWAVLVRAMPFGMINLGASFARLVKKVLNGLEAFTDSFVDDILIFSDTWPDHLAHIKPVLLSLRQVKLTAKPSKCYFCFQQLEFLAHIVKNGVVIPTQEKVRAIQEMPVPSSKRKVRSLIGFMNFYRWLIPKIAEIASPLTDLTTKVVPNKVVWTDELHVVFDG